LILAELLRSAAARLAGDEARAEAERLVAHALGCSRTWLYAHADAIVAAADVARCEAFVAARLAGRPVAYILGRQGFWTLDLRITPEVLIPRPETERLVELALARLAPGASADVADLGTGSGAVALAIARERPGVRVLATDTSAAALEVARANAVACGLGTIAFAEGNWCAALGDRRFDLIVSNPPYIAAGDAHLERGDLRFEPRLALASGDDGLDAIRTIVRDVPRHLLPGGRLLLEHGHDQGEAVRALLAQAGFDEIDTARDLAGHERVTGARRR
jgi:release factor glutamine methyltransferase